MMNPGLPFVMDSLFNRPIALTQRKAEMIVAALAGKLDVTQLTTETRSWDRMALDTLALQGRMDARLDREMRARRPLIPDGPMMTSEPYYDRPYTLSANGIAIIEVLGTLTRSYGLNPSSGTTGYDGIWTKLAFAMDDPECKAIWLKINSGGGAVDGLFDLSEAIFKCSERNGGKPIWAFAGDMAGSAAFMLGASADKFFSPQLGITGSVGCIAIYCDLTGMMEQNGIKAVIFRSPDRKAIGINGMESLDDEAIQHYQDMVEEVSDLFIDRVAQYRGIAKSRVSQTRGTDYTSTKAKAIGFIDGISSEQDAWMKLGRAIA